MNAQEIFETVSKHLFAQGKRAQDANHDVCMYRAPDGTKCAAGILIRDEDYNPAWDNSMGEVFSIDMTPYIDVAHSDLIRELQRVHDALYSTYVGVWDTTETMQKALINVAARYELDASFIPQLKFEGR